MSPPCPTGAGSSSDYGVEKALKETTLEMLKANGIAASEEKENSKVRNPPLCLSVRACVLLCFAAVGGLFLSHQRSL